jgi:Probable Zinc-ribbon domain
MENTSDVIEETGGYLCGKKREKQPLLIDVYLEFISQYWDYTKNNIPNLNLSKLRLKSSKKAWFKCHIDGHEWQSQIHIIIGRQWSKGKSGCRVCNGTAGRAKSKQNEPIGVEFPDEVDKYWLYKTNNKRGLDPLKLTSSSSKRAWFKCPIDGHEWEASMGSIKASWIKGKTGCILCRGCNLMAIRQGSISPLQI